METLSSNWKTAIGTIAGFATGILLTITQCTTATPTKDPVPVVSPTPSASPSPSATPTPVFTILPIPTDSPTPVPSVTPSVTPTPKPTVTPSPSPSPSVTPTPTPTSTSSAYLPTTYDANGIFKLNSGQSDYWGYKPTTYRDSTPISLLVWMHGCGGNAAGDVWMIAPNPTRTTQSYIAISLGGRDGACWNTGVDGPKISAAIVDVSKHFNINPRKVYLGGYSSGGDMTYRFGLENASLFAGLIVENSAPFRDTGASQTALIAAASWKINVLHLFHTSDTTYPKATVVAQLAALTAAGFPVTSVEKPGTHYDAATYGSNGTYLSGTPYDLITYALPAMDKGWTSPGPAPTPTPTPSVTPTPVVGTALRGVNLGGTEMAYGAFPQATGPVEGQNYPKHDTRLIDYFASKKVTVLRYLFSLEGMSPSIESAYPGTGNYKTYFDNYKRIVDYATSKGITVLIEPWQAAPGGDTGGVVYRGVQMTAAQFQAIWTKAAAPFASNPKVIFGLVNEPNNMSTMTWWGLAQAGINGIRAAGANQLILVPGNGWSGASTWTASWYDTDAVKRSNAYGWLNANGVGKPITDPKNNLAAEVHTYLDANQGGGAADITKVTAARDQIVVALTEGRARGYKVFLGEIGFYAGATITGTTLPASEAWKDFYAYYKANQDVLIGYAWWAAGAPGWWDDVAANGGGHFSVTPTNKTTFTGDTVNMTMIQAGF